MGDSKTFGIPEAKGLICHTFLIEVQNEHGCIHDQYLNKLFCTETDSNYHFKVAFVSINGTHHFQNVQHILVCVV